MRIIFWSNYWPRIGGQEVWAVELVASLVRQGQQVTVITARLDGSSSGRRERLNGADVHLLPFDHVLINRSPGALLRQTAKVKAIYREHDPDVVHYNFNGVSEFFALNVAKSFKAPLLVTFHGFWPELEKQQDSILYRTLREADWVTAVSEVVLAWARKLVPEIAPRSSRIYPPVDVPRNPLPVPIDVSHILFVGRLDFKKGADVALAAFARVAARFPKATLTIAGDGVERTALEQQAMRLGVRERTHFRGWVLPSAVTDLMKSATVVLVPSRTEGFGLTAAEAGAAGRPVIGSRTGGITEVVKHNETGLLVPPDDPLALADALSALLADSKRIVSLGDRARDTVPSRFSRRRQTADYLALYRRLSTMERAGH